MTWMPTWIHRSTSRRRPVQRHRFRPVLEAFEDRLVPSGNPLLEALQGKPAVDGFLLTSTNEAVNAPAVAEKTINERMVEFLQNAAVKKLQLGNGSCAAMVEQAFKQVGAKFFNDSIGVIKPNDLAAISKLVGKENTSVFFRNAVFKNASGKVLAQLNGQWLVDGVSGNVVTIHRVNDKGQLVQRTVDFARFKGGEAFVYDENYKWGLDLGTLRPGDVAAVHALEPGDVLQFRDVRFNLPGGAWWSYPHHTAQIKSIDYGAEKVTVFEQHVKVDGKLTKHVTVRELPLRALAQGAIWAYRPVTKDYVPPPPSTKPPDDKPPTVVPVPLPPKDADKEVSLQKLGFLWDVIALTKNALQAPWLSRQFGQGDDAVALKHKPGEGLIGKFVTAWLDVLAARELIVQAVVLFDNARLVGGKEQSALVAEGNRLLKEASPKVMRSQEVWAELWSATLVRTG